MGNPTGFRQYQRVELERESSEKRLKNYKEFEHSFGDAEARTQGARCMDCGIPFCHGDTGCPVDNFIPEWNDLVYRGHWKKALENLHSTNNFPEFTGRLCPAPCEAACVLGINEEPVAIKGLERTIVDNGFAEGWVMPKPAKELNGLSVAIVGSGPAGLACAQQLARAGFSVTVFEKNARVGGLMRFGIPDFKMEKKLIDRRMDQMEAEGVKFKTGVDVGNDITADEILKKYNVLVLAAGSEVSRDLPIPGRELKGVHFAMDFLSRSNDHVAGVDVKDPISAKNKNIVVIGGGDTGSDCIGTSNRQGAKSVTQLEIFPIPPEKRSEKTPWPYWPMKLKTSSSHEEGAKRLFSVNTVKFNGNTKGQLTSLSCEEVAMKNGKFEIITGSNFELKADLVFLAMGFVHPRKKGLLEQLENMGLEFDARNNVKASFGLNMGDHKTAVKNVYACGDVRRGQSLIVWAISEGRKCATAIQRDYAKQLKKTL